jgi:hypothetical protein
MKLPAVHFLLMFLLGLAFIIPAVSALTCETVPGTNYCTVNGPSVFTYTGIPFQFVTSANGIPIPLLVTYAGSTQTFSIDGAITGKIHFIEHAGVSTTKPNGYNVGKIVVYYKDGTSDSVNLVMGENIAEWAYDRPELQSTLAHNKIPPAYSVPTHYDSNYAYLGHYFYTSITTQKKPMDRVELQNTDSVVIIIDSITMDAQKLPILLVWGWHGEKSNWNVVKSRLIKKGYTVEVFDYDDSQYASVAALDLKSKIMKMKQKYNVSKIDIIAHSFGGLVARTYIEEQGGENNINHLIMVMTPNHGTGLADYLTGMKNIDRSLLGEIFNSIGVFRADSNWGSSRDLRTQPYNTFLTQLDIRFSPTGKKYLIIAGYDPYPDDIFLGKNIGKPSSNHKFLPGYDDGVVTVSSARLPGVPLSCEKLDHSDINPNLETKYSTTQRTEKLGLLYYVIDYTIIPFLKDKSPAYGSCPAGSDPYDDAGLVGLTSKVFIGIKPGETRTGNLKSTDGRFEIRFSIPLPESAAQSAMSGDSLPTNVSQFSYTLLTPSLNIVTPANVASYPGIKYIKNSSYIGYSIKNTTPGVWGYYVKAVSIPDGNASVTVTGIYNVTQYNRPIAYFTANKLSGSKPLTVKFSDKSTGMPTKWLWKFGNGNTSTLQNPTYTYTSAGNYNVRLNATNSFGTNTSAKSVSILVTN